MANTDVVLIEAGKTRFDREADLAFNRDIPDHVFWDIMRTNRRIIVASYGLTTVAQQVAMLVNVWVDGDGDPLHPYAVY